MNSYNNGSSAYKYDLAYSNYNDSSAYDLELEHQAQVLEQRRIERTNTKEKNTAAAAVLICVCLTAIFALSVALLYTRVMVIGAANRANDLKNELTTISSQNNKRSMAIEQSIDLKKIEERAIAQYNMQRPDKKQTVYVNVAQNDYAEIVHKKHTHLFGTITKSIGRALAYLN